MKLFLTLLIAMLSFPVAQCAQTAPGLQIQVLQGEGARHSTRSKRAVQTVVVIKDDTGKPLPGVQVVFQLPASGPGGSFPGGRLSQLVSTDARGQAATSGFAPNDITGRFNMKVTVNSGKQTATVIVAQINAEKTELDAAARKGSKWPWILAIAGGGAAAGIVLGARSGNSSGPAAPPPPIVLVPGTVSVGGPR